MNKKCKRILFCVVLLSFFVLVCYATIETIVADDFEKGIFGQVPSGWTINGKEITVIELKEPKNKVIFINPQPENNDVWIKKIFDKRVGRFTLKFSYCPLVSQKRSLTVSLIKFEGMDSHGPYISWRENGNIEYYDTEWHSISSYKENEWQNIKIDIDTQNKSFDFYLNDFEKPLKSKCSFRSKVSEFNSLRFTFYSVDKVLGSGYLDNIEFSWSEGIVEREEINQSRENLEEKISEIHTAYWSPGAHGGYFLTDEFDYQKVLDKTFKIFEQNPEFKMNFEVEPWTLERMKYGEKFLCEKYGREELTVLYWRLVGEGEFSTEFSSDASHSGKYGVHIVFKGGDYACARQSLDLEHLAGKEIVFCGWIRQRKGNGSHVYIEAYDSAAKIIRNSQKQTEPVPSDGNWHYVEMKWTVPDKAFVVYPQARCSGERTDTDFDDLSIKDVETGKELLLNGDFEKIAMPTLVDAERLKKIKEFVKKNQIEIVGGAYTQPFLYALDNESSIRQFTYGMQAVEDAVGVPVKIYAAQEMGMAGQLPQILSLFNFNGVLYRTSWGPGGLPPRRDVEKCWWVGRDGSRIKAVPAYTFTGWDGGTESKPDSNLIELAKSSSIENPLFAIFGDLSLRRLRRLIGSDSQIKGIFMADSRPLKVKIATLNKYFKLIGEPKLEWVDAFSGFQCYFPFGFLSGKVQHADAKAEDCLLHTERFLAILGLDRKEKIDDAWKLHLMGQHHDPWICSAGGAFGIWKQKTYEQMAVAAQSESEAICNTLMKEAGVRKTNEAKFSIVNVSGFKRKEVAKVSLELPRGTARCPVVFFENKPAPAKVKIVSRHGDDSAKEVEIEFLAEMSPFSARKCEVKEGVSLKLPEVKVNTSGGIITASNGLIHIETGKEGTTVSSHGSNVKFPMRLAGTFQEKGNLECNLILSNYKHEGATVVMYGEGEIGGMPFKNEMKITPQSPLMQMRFEFDFGSGTVVGPIENRKERKLFWGLDEQKLMLVVSLPFAEPKFFAHGPFEVRPVEQGWPVVRYAIAEGDNCGIAVFTDRVTVAVFQQNPASMETVIAHGGIVIYGSSGGRQIQPLVGKQKWDFTLMPFQGRWEKAQIPKWSEISSQPIIALSGATKEIGSIVSLNPEDEVIVTALQRNDKGLGIRLWRPYSGEASINIKVNGAKSISFANPYWEPVKLITNGSEGNLKIHKEQIITLYAEIN